MTNTEIDKMLHDAFQKAVKSRELRATWEDVGAQLEATKARMLEFQDKASELSEQIELAESEIEELSPQNVSFDVLAEKRKALRGMTDDRDDLLLWIKKLSDEGRRLYGEHHATKRMLDEAIHGEVLNPVFMALNTEFRRMIAEMEVYMDSWTAAWADFRSQIGGSVCPHFTASSPAVYDSLEGLFS